MENAFVLDNSVAMAWCFLDEWTAYTDSVQFSLETTCAVVPCIWHLEAGNSLLSALRRNRITEMTFRKNMQLLNTLNIEVDRESPERMLGEIVWLAKEQRLSTYDASYLDLAMRRGLPLATQDKTLLRVAGSCGVGIYAPDSGA